MGARRAGQAVCASSVRRWGWRELLAEAIHIEPDGLELWEGVVDDRANSMLAALVEARDELGRWPFAEEWEQSGRKPSSWTVVRYFGNWEAARTGLARSSSGLDLRVYSPFGRLAVRSLGSSARIGHSSMRNVEHGQMPPVSRSSATRPSESGRW